MIRNIASAIGRRFVRQTVASAAPKVSGGAIDPKFGLRLLRDNRVPIKSKITALALGLGALFLLEILELPLQVVMSLLLPLVGVAADFAMDGIELLTVPMLVASLTLQWIAPREIVEQIRAEGDGRVYEAARID